ncbi:PH domain-containing protein [Aquisalimonas asiatica]|uniref:PH domain-containing protein n=1 Tax=Aquisalimonas asiatica TaxID=406100 RepID=A0A1H8T056_9GAMM|nr:PH domain-containing protein [Aquisalimonas asiatica]SEO84282.1 PH domain-containing protein [Aquisalimonas asiatica]
MKAIRQPDGTPYPSLGQAEAVRDALGQYTGQAFEAMQETGGYVVRPSGVHAATLASGPAMHSGENAPSPIVLRQAVRGHLGLLVWCLTGLGLLLITPRLVETLGALPGVLGTTAAQPVTVPLVGAMPAAQLVLAAVAVLILTVASVRLLLAIFYYRYELGPEAICVQEGIIARRVRRMYYRNARIPTMTQSLLERLLGIGTVAVSSAGGGETGEIRLAGIRQPASIKATIQERIERQTLGGRGHD